MPDMTLLQKFDRMWELLWKLLIELLDESSGERRLGPNEVDTLVQEFRKELAATQQRTAYIVTMGTYSDYHIVGAYSTQEFADAHIAAKHEESWAMDMCVEPLLMDKLVPARKLGLFP